MNFKVFKALHQKLISLSFRYFFLLITYKINDFLVWFYLCYVYCWSAKDNIERREWQKKFLKMLKM